MAYLIPAGMDSVNGQQTISSAHIIRNDGGSDSSLIQTSGALPTTTFTSGTGKQISTVRDVNLYVSITYNSTAVATATCKVEVSPDNITYSTLSTETVPALLGLAGAIRSLTVPLYRGFYIRLTVTNATIGTGTYW